MLKITQYLHLICSLGMNDLTATTCMDIYRYTSFFRPYEMLVSRYFNNIYLLRWLSVPKRVYASDTKSRHLSLSSALSSNSSSNVHCIFDNSTENPIKTIHKHILLSITSSCTLAVCEESRPTVADSQHPTLAQTAGLW